MCTCRCNAYDRRQRYAPRALIHAPEDAHAEDEECITDKSGAQHAMCERVSAVCVCVCVCACVMTRARRGQFRVLSPEEVIQAQTRKQTSHAPPHAGAK